MALDRPAEAAAVFVQLVEIFPEDADLKAKAQSATKIASSLADVHPIDVSVDR
jgi:hypothetical protein